MTISQKTIDAVIARRRTGEFQASIGVALGISGSTVNAICKTAALNGQLGFKPVLDGFAVTQVTSTPKGDFIQQKPEHGSVFEVPDGHRVSGVSALVDPDGREIVKWVKTKDDGQQAEFTREAIKEMFAEWKGKSEVLKPRTGGDPNRIALIPTADVHFGLLAWGKDSERAWDLDIAKHELLSATSELIELTPRCHTCVLLDVGDQFHMNDQSNATPTNKNRLDIDGRFPKVAKAGVKLRKTMIEMALQRFDRVIYRGLSGNHDPEAQMWLSIALSEFFDNNPLVEIDTNPSEFWAYEFGNTFLYANHGHKIKPDRLPGLMAADYPAMWGRTTHRYAFSGHIHRERSGEDLGVRWETLRTLTPADNYAWTSGWRSGHELTSITYSSETGQRHRQFVPV